MSTVPVAEGDLLLEKYRVERVLGRGGMGVVVAATHVDLDQKVALKFLLPEALDHPTTVERFAREAKAAARIHSPHAVRVIDTGKMESGTPFMVMEYLEGRDLSEILDLEGSLEPNVAIDYVLQACEALAEAHAAGIVHRDLKPANLFLAKQADRRSIIKVLDFGISKLEGDNVSPLTHSSTILGSAQYMSPEQLMSSKTVDARADIWALGVILYELIGGKRPFDGETMPEVIAQILQNRPERLSTLAPKVTLDLELVIGRCMSRANERFESVAALAVALKPFSKDPKAVTGAAERMRRVLGGASLPPSPPSSASPQREPAVPDSGFVTGPTQPPPGAAEGPTTQVSALAATSASDAKIDGVVSAIPPTKPSKSEDGVPDAQAPVVEPSVVEERRATPATATAVVATPTASTEALRETTERKGPSRWPLVVVAAAVLLAVPWVLLRRGPETERGAPAPSGTVATPAMASAMPSASAMVSASAMPSVSASASAAASATASTPEPSALPSITSSARAVPPRIAPKPTPSSPPSADPKKSPLNMGIK